MILDWNVEKLATITEHREMTPDGPLTTFSISNGWACCCTGELLRQQPFFMECLPWKVMNEWYDAANDLHYFRLQPKE